MSYVIQTDLLSLDLGWVFLQRSGEGRAKFTPYTELPFDYCVHSMAGRGDVHVHISKALLLVDV